MVYGYIRVSTDNQNTQNQKMEIQNFCQRENLIVDSWIEDVISGTKSPQQRKLGKIIMENCKEGDLIICTELSNHLLLFQKLSSAFLRLIYFS